MRACAKGEKRTSLGPTVQTERSRFILTRQLTTNGSIGIAAAVA
jgi:hypothetical protein